MTASSDQRWTAAVLAVACAVQIVSLLAVRHPPLQDYPNHLLRMHAQQRLATTPIYATHLRSDHAFRPNLLMDLYLAGLAAVLPLRAAGRLLLISGLLLTHFAVWRYLRRFGGGVLAALIAIHLLVAWPFLKGFLNFYAGMGFGLLYLTTLWPAESSALRWPRLVGAVVLALLTVLAHGFAFLAFAAFTTAAALADRGQTLAARLLRPATAVPAALLLLLFVRQQAPATTLLENRPVYDSQGVELLVLDPLSVWLRGHPFLDYGSALLSYGLLGLGLAATAGLAWRRQDAAAGRLVAVAAAAMALYLLAPDELSGGWAHGRHRLLCISLLLLLPLLAALPWQRLRQGAVLVLGGTQLAALGLGVLAFQRFDRAATDFLTLGAGLQRGALILPVDTAPITQPLRPGLHLWAYLCIERDCLAPYLFANRYAQNVYFEHLPPTPPEGQPAPEDWQPILDTVAAGGYDAVLLHGRSAVGEGLLATVLAPAGSRAGGVLFVRPNAAGSARQQRVADPRRGLGPAEAGGDGAYLLGREGRPLAREALDAGGDGGGRGVGDEDAVDAVRHGVNGAAAAAADHRYASRRGFEVDQTETLHVPRRGAGGEHEEIAFGIGGQQVGTGDGTAEADLLGDAQLLGQGLEAGPVVAVADHRVAQGQARGEVVHRPQHAIDVLARRVAGEAADRQQAQGARRRGHRDLEEVVVDTRGADRDARRRHPQARRYQLRRTPAVGQHLAYRGHGATDGAAAQGVAQPPEVGPLQSLQPGRAAGDPGLEEIVAVQVGEEGCAQPLEQGQHAGVHGQPDVYLCALQPVAIGRCLAQHRALGEGHVGQAAVLGVAENDDLVLGRQGGGQAAGQLRHAPQLGRKLRSDHADAQAPHGAECMMPEGCLMGREVVAT